MTVMEKLTEGLWRWTARHPEWHPGEFGAEVASFAAQVAGDHTVLIDPILPADADTVWELLDDLVTEQLTIAITIPYHTRDAEPIWKRYRDRGVSARITGHTGVTRRLNDASGFTELLPGDDSHPFTAFNIGKPRRNELPIHLPSHDAIAFGDALVVTPEHELRLWDHDHARLDA